MFEMGANDTYLTEVLALGVQDICLRKFGLSNSSDWYNATSLDQYTV
jgi:hypothetical protein